VSSPCSRSLAYLRRQGYVAGVVERWNAHAGVRGIRQDFLGIIDLIGVRVPLIGEGGGVLGVQATTADNLAARLKKARATPELHTWIGAGARFELHAWGKRKDGRWHVRVVALTGQDLEPVDLTPRPRRGRNRQRGLFDREERRDRPGKAAGIARDAAADARQAMGEGFD
jgi:hypothetical protein